MSRYCMWLKVSGAFSPSSILECSTVASVYISAAGKRVSEMLEAKNNSSQLICKKMCCGHAWSEQLVSVVEDNRCIQPKFSSKCL